MAIEITHTFVSLKGDGSDATLIRPSNWNDTHTIEMASGNIIGRTAVGAGDAEEIPATSYMLGLLASADYAALALALGLPTTGDARLTYKTSAPAGWVMANDGTIGSLTSGATVAATNTQDLFTHFYNAFSDATAPVQTSSGSATTRVAQGTAATAWASSCRMVLPKNLGRALLIGGAGSGLTSRTLGSTGGAESHTLVLAELPASGVAFSGATLSAAPSISGTATGSASVSGSATGTTGDASADHTHNWSFTNATTNTTGAHTHIVGDASLGGSLGGTGLWAHAPPNTLDWPSSSNGDHSHTVSASGATTGMSVQHNHSFNTGTITSTGSASLTNWTGVTLSVSGVTVSGTTNNLGSGTAHNNMQPWTAWNIMIRL